MFAKSLQLYHEVGMLNHVNTDIAVDVFEVLSELTDPEVLSPLAWQQKQSTFDATSNPRVVGD